MTLNFLDFPALSYAQELPLINSPNDEMIVNLCLGTPTQCFNVLIDSGSFVLWVTNFYSNETPDANNKFDFKKSSTFSNTNKPYSIQYGTGSAQGQITRDVVSMGKTKLPNFDFILVDKEEGHADLDGILGLGYNYDGWEDGAEAFSLIDRLHSENLIKRKIFTQKYLEDNKGKMIIGDLPEEITNDMENYGNCTLIKNDRMSGRKNPMWQCEMTLVSYGDSEKDVISVRQPALIDTGTNLIVAPISFLAKLFKNYFSHPSVNGHCILDAPDGRFYSILCNRYSKVLALPSIYFVIGEWGLMMRPREMFYRFPDGSIRFIISSEPSLNEWIIGEPLLKKFHMVFDKENNVIGFYGKDDKVKYTGHLPQPTPEDTDLYALVLFFIIIGVLLLILAFIIWVVIRIFNYCKSKKISNVEDIRYHAFRSN